MGEYLFMVIEMDDKGGGTQEAYCDTIDQAWKIISELCDIRKKKVADYRIDIYPKDVCVTMKGNDTLFIITSSDDFGR